MYLFSISNYCHFYYISFVYIATNPTFFRKLLPPCSNSGMDRSPNCTTYDENVEQLSEVSEFSGSSYRSRQLSANLDSRSPVKKKAHQQNVKAFSWPT